MAALRRNSIWISLLTAFRGSGSYDLHRGSMALCRSRIVCVVYLETALNCSCGVPMPWCFDWRLSG